MEHDTALLGDSTATPAPAEQPVVEEEMLIEEISIDGMCGVY